MMNDTVREDLQTKITLAAPRPDVKIEPRKPLASPSVIAPLPVIRRSATSSLAAAKARPTLVEFQNKNASLPEWRLQLQNAVQQRKGVQNPASDAAVSSIHVRPNGLTETKTGLVQRAAAEPVPEFSDPRVANALRRISESGKTFGSTEAIAKGAAHPKKAPAAPFTVVTPTRGVATGAAAAPAKITYPSKPILAELTPFAYKRDTNKLSPIEDDIVVVNTEEPISNKDIAAFPAEIVEMKRIHIKAEGREIEPAETVDIDTDDIEDLAPFSMRFGAGLFDLIIGAFAGMLILSPVVFTSGDWWTTAGLVTLAGICSIVMFLYLTLCLGFFGKTMGMRLFSLELVDALENEYPTLSQAAVSSAIFLLALPFGGLGFLTVFYNEENRALHDLLSGTIIVREF